MKRKIVLLAVIIASLSFLCGSMLAQGIYSKNNGSKDSDSQETSSGVGLRGPRDPADPNGGNGNHGGEAGNSGDESAPVGEGLVFLTILAGGYAILKKRKLKEGE